MSNYKRRRKSASEDLQKATSVISRKDMSRINLWVPKKDYDKLKMSALKRGRTVSDIMRELIKGYV